MTNIKDESVNNKSTSENSTSCVSSSGNVPSNKKRRPLFHSQFSNVSFGSFGSGQDSSGGTSGNSSPSAISQLTSSTSFPRVTLRSLLINSPFSRRPKERRGCSISKSKRNSEQESTSMCFSLSDKNEFGGASSKNGASLKRYPGNHRPSIGTKNQSTPGSSTKPVSLGPFVEGDPSAGSHSTTTAATSSLKRSVQPSTSISQPSSSKLRECPLCLQELEADKFPELLTCSHSGCLSCMKQYLIVEITESRINISCPQCHALLHPTDIHLILNNSILSYKYEDFMLRRVLSMDPDTRWCPAPDCGYAVIAAGCASCPKLKCERPGCQSYFCYHCKAEWHPNQTCDMARAQRSPNAPFSPFSHLHDVLNNDDVKACPRCQVLIVKMDDGSCNHITCSVCSAEFCWLCMKEISDLHYLSPSGCTFWGKKPWSRKKKIMWQLGTLVGAPLGIGLVAGLAVPAMIIGIPIWVGRKIHARYANKSKHKRNLAMVGGITASAVISPVLAGLAVSIGVPILLAYVYGVVPISLCRSGGCGVTTSASGVRIAFDDENDMVIGIPGRQSAEPSQSAAGNPSIGEVSCGASFSAESGAHLLEESDRESASNVAIAPASRVGSIASSSLSQSHRLEVQADIVHGNRSLASADTTSLALSERSTHTIDMENASTKALAGSLLHYKLHENEEGCSLSMCSSRAFGGDSVSGVMEASSLHHPNVTNLYIHPIATSHSENSSGVLNTDASSLHSAYDMRLDSVSAIITARQMSGRTSKGVTFNDSMEHIVDHFSLPLDTDDENLEEEMDLLKGTDTKGCCGVSITSNSVVLEMEEEDKESSEPLYLTPSVTFTLDLNVPPKCREDLLNESECNTDRSDKPLIVSNLSTFNVDSELRQELSVRPKINYAGQLKRSASVASSFDSPPQPLRSKSYPKLDCV